MRQEGDNHPFFGKFPWFLVLIVLAVILLVYYVRR
jgi:hypothetical protein